MEHLVQAARPGVVLHRRPSRADELVLAGGGEVFRLPLAPSAAARHAVLVKALPKLAPLVPVALAPPRYVGVLDDGATPFTAERRLPGVRPQELEGIAQGQLDGVLAALAAVPPREAAQWGVPVRTTSTGERVPPADLEGLVLHHRGLPALDVLLADPRTGLLTGVVDWDLLLARPSPGA